MKITLLFLKPTYLISKMLFLLLLDMRTINDQILQYKGDI